MWGATLVLAALATLVWALDQPQAFLVFLLASGLSFASYLVLIRSRRGSVLGGLALGLFATVMHISIVVSDDLQAGLGYVSIFFFGPLLVAGVWLLESVLRWNRADRSS
jgi:hypothetical protein